MAKIPVKHEGRYEIFYDPDQKKFSAEVDGDEVITGTTQEQVEEFAKKLVKRQFQRIPVLRAEYGGVFLAEITSTTSGYGGYTAQVWIVSEGHREKVQLRSLYQRTAKNMGLFTQIAEKSASIEVLKKELKVLVEGLEAPITEENLLVLAGVEKEKGEPK